MYGALELFKKADTPENFEKAINSDDNDVNHLDLDGDGKADYIRVVDEKYSDIHVLALQVSVSASEIQKIALIVKEETGNGKMHIQIFGDETLYGKNYTIESEDKPEIVTAEKTVTDTDAGSGESDDDIYSTSDKSGYTSPDLQVIEPIATKVAYHAVQIVGSVVKDMLRSMLKSIIEEAIPALKTE